METVNPQQMKALFALGAIKQVARCIQCHKALSTCRDNYRTTSGAWVCGACHAKAAGQALDHKARS